MLVGTNASLHADVAQPVARNVANVEATGSIPVVRSISGVPVHKHRAGPVCMCAGAAAPACSESLGLRAARVRTQPRWKFQGGLHRHHASLTQRPECRPVSAEAAGSTPARRARSRKPLRLFRCRMEGAKPSSGVCSTSPRGGTGRRAWLRTRSRETCPFESDRGDQVIEFASSHRRLAQLAEHRLDKAGVAGSEPAASTIFNHTSRCGAAGSASRLGREGRRFEPCRRDHPFNGACSSVGRAPGRDPGGRRFESDHAPHVHLVPAGELTEWQWCWLAKPWPVLRSAARVRSARSPPGPARSDGA